MQARVNSANNLWMGKEPLTCIGQIKTLHRKPDTLMLTCRNPARACYVIDVSCHCGGHLLHPLNWTMAHIILLLFASSLGRESFTDAAQAVLSHDCECFHSERWDFGFVWHCWRQQAYRCLSSSILTIKVGNWVTSFTKCRQRDGEGDSIFVNIEEITQMPHSEEKSIVIWRSSCGTNFQRKSKGAEFRLHLERAVKHSSSSFW